MPDTQDINLIRSEEVQEILTAVPNWMIRWGNTIIFIFILGILLITWFIKYPDIIPSEAMLTTKIPPQKEFARISGKIDTILVSDNQKISEGTPLVIIENTANYKDVFFLKSILDTIKPDMTIFQFPIDEIPILFLGEIEAEYAVFENTYLEYKLNKKLQPYSNEAIANNVTISELKIRLFSLQSQKKLNETELSFQKDDVERHKLLYEKGVISLQEYERKQASYLQAVRNYESLDASISQIREAIGNANKIAVGTSITKIKEEIGQLKSVIQAFNQLKKTVKEWEMKYVLSSNINGTVSFFNIWNENQSVTAGDLVVTILPENNNQFIAKLKTPSQNSGKIKKGQKVRINLDNYPEKEFGSLEGIISSVSIIPNKEGFYLIDVDLPEKLITSYQNEINFKQEMQGSAEIITQDLRLFERFFYRLRGLFSG
jgi:multidrug resistance efflux pump